MAEDPFSRGRPQGGPVGPIESPPSLLAVLVFDLAGTAFLVTGLFLLLVPDQQWIPQSSGLPDNALGLLVFGMALIGIAVYLLVKRIRIMGSILGAPGRNGG